MTNKQLTRREFLKIAAGLTIASTAGIFLRGPVRAVGHPDFSQSELKQKPNIIIILLDAFSARHLTGLGYPRNTSVNIERFFSKATVYHNHHAAGNFTTPSTASLLTGLYPWKHRAFTYGNQVQRRLTKNNLFELLAGEYFQVAYTQNLYAEALLRQFSDPLNRHIPISSFSLMGSPLTEALSQRDAFYAMSSLDDFLFEQEETSGSLFLSTFNDLARSINLRRAEAKYRDQYPVGFPKQPKTNLAFTIDQVLGGVASSIKQWPQPFLAYLHFIPPHAPYKPSKDYVTLFDDGWSPIEKPAHPLSKGTPQMALNKARRQYDQFIANIDGEIGKLFTTLEDTGLLENSYVIFTSDHGEMFERGMSGHSTRMLNEPIVHVPLFISRPGQTTREDVIKYSSTVDLLPTLLHLTGLPIPDWCEGLILPQMGGGLTGERTDDVALFTVEAKSNPVLEPLRKVTLGMYQDHFKAIQYLGYGGVKEKFEFFDLETDPEELEDLSGKHPRAKEFQANLKQKLDEENQNLNQGSSNP